MECLSVPLAQLACGFFQLKKMINRRCDFPALVFSGQVIQDLFQIVCNINFYLAMLAVVQIYPQLVM